MEIIWIGSDDCSDGQKERLTEVANTMNRILGNNITKAIILARYDGSETIEFYRGRKKVVTLSAADDGVDGAYLELESKL